MTNDKKPREWTLECIGDIANGSDKIVVSGPWVEHDKLKPIHVIEMSAYAQLQEENEDLRRLKDELSTAGQRGVEELAKENEELKAKLLIETSFADANKELFDSGEPLRQKLAKENAALRESLKLAVEALSKIERSIKKISVREKTSIEIFIEEWAEEVLKKLGKYKDV